ncbi:hypothetical protein EGM97_08840 [Pseudomonas sp. AF32]|nr:hypothetical protein [Pseudomonas sp. AF32]
MYTQPENTREPLWERACSRRRLHTQNRCQLIHRFREQARSHRGIVASSRPRYTQIPVRPGGSKPTP